LEFYFKNPEPPVKVKFLGFLGIKVEVFKKGASLGNS
jgi:hypothetical protein